MERTVPLLIPDSLRDGISALASTVGVPSSAVYGAAMAVFLDRQAAEPQVVATAGPASRRFSIPISAEPSFIHCVRDTATKLEELAECPDVELRSALPAVFVSSEQGDTLEPVFIAVASNARSCMCADAQLQPRWEVLLAGLLADPETRPSHASAITTAETWKVVGDWNNHHAEFPAVPIHELVQEQVQRTPAATAIVSDAGDWTYSELSEAAGRVSRALRRAGLEPGGLTGIMLDRSPAAIATTVGVLQAGGACLPLDPDLPALRLALIFEDAQIRLLVTERKFADALITYKGQIIWFEDTTAATIDSVSAPVRLDHLAYAIYTSGSTGRPKAALLRHRGIVNHGSALARIFGLEPEDRVLHMARLTSDISLEEIFPTLISGSTIVVAPPQRWASIGEFVAFIESHRISVLNLPTTFWSTWVAESHHAQWNVPECVRLVVVGGEAALPARVRQWQDIASPDIRWINTYGPAESTVTTTFFELRAGAPCDNIPIGRPIPNVRVYILDEALRPVPPGVAGEIFIGGAGVAQGYLNRPELTTEAFVPDPFSAPPDNMYRTGDLGRYLPDGNLEFLGRRDDQVKIRGNRVEPGEVSTLILGHPDVLECAVVPVDSESDCRELLACITPKPGCDLHPDKIRAFVAERAAPFMVPAHITLAQSVPRTTSGKVDRRALIESLGTNKTSAAPQQQRRPTPVDSVADEVREIWREVLRVTDLDPGANLFEFGCDSLRTIQALSRIEARFGIRLTFADLLATPSVHAIASRIADGSGEFLAPSGPTLQHSPAGTPRPLSFAQARMWLGEQMAPGTSLFLIPVQWTIRGPLVITALQQAISEIVRRHEVLRTIYSAEDGVPMQTVCEAVLVPVPVVDLSDLHEAERQAAAHRMGAEEARQPFDLARDLMLRATILRLSPDHHELLLTIHHIASDGWSMGVFCREFSSLYQALVKGAGSELPKMSVQYADYASWERQRLTGDILEQHLSYWREELDGAPPSLELPLDYARPPKRTYAASIACRTLPRSLVQRLERLAQQHNATLYVVLLAGWQTLLHRYTGADDICTGSPSANRTWVETEPLIGFFVNTLVLRARLEADLTFAEFLTQARDTFHAAMAHQELPFDRVVQELDPERSSSFTPFFQNMFILQNVGSEETIRDIPGLDISITDRDTGMTEFDTILSVDPSESSDWLVSLRYDTSLFAPETGRQIVQQYADLLEDIATAPQKAISALRLTGTSPVLPPETVFDTSGSVVTWFEEQVRSSPESVAVSAESGSITYAELNRRADQLAAALQLRGVQRGATVPIFMERSISLVIAVLGVLKAGAAYVPVDPSYPSARIDYMLADSSAAAIITHRRLAAHVRDDSREAVCIDDDDFSEIEAVDRRLSPVRVAADDPAYIIYTSGSTGKPKGAVIPHRALFNHMRWMLDEFGICPSDCVVQKTPMSFDASVWEFFAPLLCGGRLVVARPGGHADTSYLSDLIIQEQVTILQVVPSMLAALVDEPRFSRCTSLRVVFAGGEVLTSTVVEQFHRIQAAELCNLYGPTETCIDAAFWRCPREPSSGPVPIGRAISNTWLYVLDPSLNPVPARCTGELYIGGAGLALGYLNAPDLTAERFITNPFAADDNARLYKTGDLVRCRHDGIIEFLGRADSQVKVRGFRIEPAEVESVFRSHPDIRECAVVASQESLTAYYVAAPGAEMHHSDLREYLRRTLPDYCVPGSMVGIDELPKLPNGKIDRRALPSVPVLKAPASTPLPSTPMEHLVAAIWRDVLEVETVGIHDNFFESGGHSLKAMRVISRIRRSTSVNARLPALFEFPTVALMARHLESLSAGNSPSGDCIQPVRRDGAVPVSDLQAPLWLFQLVHPDSGAYNIPDALRLRGSLDPVALHRALSEIVRRHEILRTVYTAEAGLPVQRVLEPAPVHLPVTDLTGLDAAEQESAVTRLAHEEARQPFNLSRDLMLRAALIRLAGDHHVLLLTMHHIASDGWSVRIFYRELAALYEAFLNNEPSPLDELPVQYADYASWQRQWLTGEVLDEHLGYWRKQLDGAPVRVSLPRDYPYAADRTHAGATMSSALRPDLLSRLEAVGQQHGATLYMTMLAACQALLHRHTGDTDICTATPVANRTRVETEGLIGFFVNTLVIRTRLEANLPFTHFLAQVRDTVLAGMAHQDLPFDRMVRELSLARNPGQTPFLDTFFVFENSRDGALRLQDMQVEDLRSDVEGAKFDLTLGVEASPGHEPAVSIRYKTDTFRAETARRLLDGYVDLLEAIANAPEASVRELHVGTTTNQQGETVEYYTGDVATLFEAQVERTPNDVAAECASRRLTYAELNTAANALASHLGHARTGPGSFVPVLVNGGLEYLVAILAVMKSGAAFVPLDTNWPADRLFDVLGELGSDVVVVDAAAANLACVAGRTALVVDTTTTHQQFFQNPPRSTSPNDPVYAIYTSGTTGRPKAAVIAHRNLLNRFFWMDSWFSRGAVALQTTRHVFDSSVWQLVWPLLSGGKTVIPAPGMTLTLASFINLLSVHKVTITDFVPSLFAALFVPGAGAGTNRAHASSLRDIVVGGEEITPAVVHRFLKEWPGIRVTNLYGPTEATIGCIFHPIDGTERERIPIGRPIPNTRAYILDQDRTPVPAGAAGELFLGGACVGLGYLANTARTNEVFLPDPFAPEPGATMYKTGDLVRLLPNGEIQFLGRVDRQVKIRGFRIEPEEIEAILRLHPSVADAAVVVQGTEDEEKRLVAFVVPATEHVTPAELRQYLKQKLPAHMVPSWIEQSRTLPLTAGGKIDRRTLPHITPTTTSSERPLRTTTEVQVAAAFEEVLHVRGVGSDDDFFDLGGSSLLAVQLVAKLEKIKGSSIRLPAFLSRPTVEHAAALLDEDQAESDGAPIVTCVKRGNGGTPLFALIWDPMDVRRFGRLVQYLETDGPVYTVTPELPTQTCRRSAIPAAVPRIVDAIMQAHPGTTCHIVGYCLGAQLAFEVAHALTSAGQPVGLVTLVDAYSPLYRDPYRTWLHLQSIEFTNRSTAERFEYALQLLGRLKAALFGRGRAGIYAAVCRARNILPRSVEASIRRKLDTSGGSAPLVYTGAMVLLRASVLPPGVPRRTPGGWDVLAGAGLVLEEIPGDHDTIFEEPGVRAMASKLSSLLAEASSRSLTTVGPSR